MELDFAIVNTPHDLYDDQVSIEVAEFEDMFVCERKYRELAEREISLQELTKYPLILMTQDSSARQYFDNLFQTYGVTLDPDIEFPP